MDSHQDRNDDELCLTSPKYTSIMMSNYSYDKAFGGKLPKQTYTFLHENDQSY